MKRNRLLLIALSLLVILSGCKKSERSAYETQLYDCLTEIYSAPHADYPPRPDAPEPAPESGVVVHEAYGQQLHEYGKSIVGAYFEEEALTAALANGYLSVPEQYCHENGATLKPTQIQITTNTASEEVTGYHFEITLSVSKDDSQETVTITGDADMKGPDSAPQITWMSINNRSLLYP